MTIRIQSRTRILLMASIIVSAHTARAGAVHFTLKKSVTGGGTGQVAWGDYDNDGDLDLLTTGAGTFGGGDSGIAKIYEYDNNTFTEDTAAGAGLHGAISADADWGDFDNDGDLDLFITGQESSSVKARVYTNNGATFAVKKTYHSYFDASGEWGDSDNDGDLDLLMSGDYGVWPGGGKFLRVFEYDGTGFKTGADFGAVHKGSAEWGDFDNDGDLDALVTGSPFFTGAISKVYGNTEAEFASIASMTGLQDGDASFGDYDGDGDLDVALMGSRFPGVGGIQRITKLYENTGSGLVELTALTGVELGQLAWGDYDNDGDLDLLVAGTTTGAYNGTLTRIYRNDGGGAFSVDSGASNDIVNVYEASVAWGDYDRDGDLDIAISGYTGSSTTITRIYESDAADTGSANTPPQPPTNLQRTLLGTSIMFSWSPGSDVETPTSGLTYNLRVGTYPGGGDVVGSMTVDGQATRLVDEYGNTNHNLSWTIHGLTDGPYYWSVQTIDTGFAPSPFVSSGPVFVIPPNNDNCEDAIEVVNGTYEFENLAASNDGPSEPTPCGFSQGEQIGTDVWFRYTPACNGTVHLSSCGSDFDTAMAVYYIGGACPIAPSASFCNDDSCGAQSELDVPATAGEPFIIRVGGVDGAIGHGTLTISQSAVSNDSCENAIPNSGDILSVTSNLGCATNDGTASCGAADSSDVWYEYTAPTTGILRVRTCNTHDSGGVDSGTDTIVSVHSGCPGSGGTELACNDDWTDGNYRNACTGSDVGTTRDSALATPITEGETVYIRVSNYSLGATGNIYLVAFVSPLNDDCDAAEVITDGQTVGTTAYSTSEGTSSSGSSALNTDVWYEYTATCTGFVRADTCGSEMLDSVDTVLSVHVACPEDDDTHELALNNDVADGNDPNACGASTLDSAILLPVTLGETVRLRVSRYQTSSSGEFLLNLSCLADCNTNGVLDEEEPDSDGDTVIDDCDVCAGFDDNADADDDGTPDGCDKCPGFDDTNDADTDGVPDGCDTCAGFDDRLDCNSNGVADGCEMQADPSGFASRLSKNTTGFADSNFTGIPDDNFIGIGGQTVEFDFSDLPVVNGLGSDFNVYEVDNGGVEFSSIDVLASSNGIDFASLRNFATAVVRIPGDALHGNDGFARSYDLSAVGLSSARFIRIVGDGSSPAGPATGFDLDAVGVIHFASGTDCNANNIPDACDPDADGDEVPDMCDVCPGLDDTIDTDGDTIPNGCDDCAGGWASGDADGNGVVNVEDYADYNACLLGPDSGSGVGCECFDFDNDGDVDLGDFVEMQVNFTGSQ